MRSLPVLDVAPPFHGPRDVPTLRRWLQKHWHPGGMFFDAYADHNYGEWERRALANASQWWVSTEMVSILNAAASTIPEDVCPGELPMIAPCGIVVFETPLLGTDVNDGGEILVDAVTWQTSMVSGPQRERTVCLTMSSYHAFAYVDGELNDKTAVEASDAKFAGYIWTPIGRSDWPLDDRLDQAPFELTELELASFIEDRRWMAALFTLLHQEGISSRTTESPPRPERRRLARDGVEPRQMDVQVVRLRRPRSEEGESGEPDGEGRSWSHRWLVGGHWRWQPYGKGRELRRLTYIAPYVKGPADKPLRTPEKVQAWVR